MKSFYLIIIFIFLLSCQTLSSRNEERLTWSTLSSLNPGSDTKEVVQQKLGAPSEVVSGSNKNSEQWVYKCGESPKVWLFFNGNTLTQLSQSIWEQEEESDLKALLSKFSGKWKIEGEPDINPHAMPSLCYLIDDAGGKSIQIHGHKKLVEDITRWDPKMPPPTLEEINQNPEFCVANLCSKMSKNFKYKSHHCDWLKKELEL